MTEPDPLLKRAATFLRSAPEPGWDAISDRVLAAVHAVPRVGWPLRVGGIMDAAERGSVYITDHALRSILARELRRRYLCQPTSIKFTLDGTALRSVVIEVTGSYNTSLRELGDEVRHTVVDLINRILGASDGSDVTTARPIDVTITDVVTGDPMHT
ncbi:MAG: hypothetical protein WBB07_00300 [Mycobacterium sp.]